MSEDNATDAHDADGASTSEPAPESFVGDEPARRGNLRQIILLCLLGLMLVALAYDYGVARPNVEKAFDQIVKLNDEMNISADPVPTLSTHIHKEIKRGPTRRYTEGPYQIEVFSWTAGLPFRSHNLYAVYYPNGNDLVFMRPYKFQLPLEELKTTAVPMGPAGDESADGQEEPFSDEIDGGDPPDGEGGGPGGGGPGRGGPGRGGPGGGGPGGGGPGRGGPGRGGPGRGGPGGDGEGRPQRPTAEDDTPDVDGETSTSADPPDEPVVAPGTPDSDVSTPPENATLDPGTPEKS